MDAGVRRLTGAETATPVTTSLDAARALNLDRFGGGGSTPDTQNAPHLTDQGGA
ncbi:hypothetical protein [Rhodococcus qingshengii]|uniref:hypothetical protein n=1 Tax=Rhodococcus qingshengii TaxID=334542 RepID=UPI00287F98E5|nr:hypothetical protein [Rhodococcus qingshengii]